MILKRMPVWLGVLLILAIIIMAALWLRVLLPYNQVFVNDWVKLTGVDAYYYGRLVDNVAQHFPVLTEFDPYYLFPKGTSTSIEPNFFAYLIGGIIWLLGLGRPDQHLTDLVLVYVPPILAVLTIMAAFFIGKALKNIWAGLLAAGMLAIMPGEFLNRSLLGYADQHIAESMFVAFFIMFVMFAFKECEGMDLSFLRDKGWRAAVKPAIYCVLAGMALALYMLTWAGAALILLIFFVFLVIQVIVDYIKGRSVYITGALGVVIFLVGLVFYMPAGRSYFSSLSIIGGIILIVLITAMAGFMQRRRIKSGYYLLTLVVLGILGIGLVYVINPAMYALIIDRLLGIFGWNPDTTIMEMQPLLLSRGDFTLGVAYGNFTVGLILGLAGLVLVIYQSVKQPGPTKILLIVWSILMMLAAIAMRRFCYYFAVNLAVLSGYFIWWILSLVGFGRQSIPENAKSQAYRTKAERMRVAKAEKSRNPVFMGITLVIALFVMVYPNLGPLPGGSKPAIDVATRPLFAPTNYWFESLEWLRSNSPEPLGDANAYYSVYKAPGEAGGFVYPKDAYGVLAWWDYGYWITRIGRRIPYSNPGTSGLGGEAYFLLAQDEQAAGKALKDANIKYFIIDSDIASYEGKYFALANWYGGSYHDYYDIYLKQQDNKYTPVILFYPAYYQSMVIRMYNFDGKQVTPDAVTVISYQNVIASDDKQYMAITGTSAFGSVQEANEFIKSQQPGTCRIAGYDPYVSPVPLDALKNHTLVYNSKQAKQTGQVVTPYIKIFQKLP